MDNLDQDLDQTMDALFSILKEHVGCNDTDDQLRLRIVGHNLRALAQVLMIADGNPDIGLNLKQVILGILGTSDWALKNIPALEQTELTLPDDF